jgi:hypothetical protein
MTEVAYSLAKGVFSEDDVPMGHDFAIVSDGRLVQRHRAGKAFPLTYRTEGPARHGLAVAAEHVEVPPTLWRRYP